MTAKKRMQKFSLGHVKFLMVIRHSNEDISEAFPHELLGAQKRFRIDICIGNNLHVQGI